MPDDILAMQCNIKAFFAVMNMKDTKITDPPPQLFGRDMLPVRKDGITATRPPIGKQRLRRFIQLPS